MSKSPNHQIFLKLLVIVGSLIVADLCTGNFLMRKFGCPDGAEASLYPEGASLSPDREFRVAVCKESWYSYLPTIGPGSLGDAPGYVRLYNREGVLLEEQRVEMLILAERLERLPERVDVGTIAHWGLPKSLEASKR